MTIVFFIVALWATSLTLLFWLKKDLFIKTWNEPYFFDTPILIESDDWGPGGGFHAKRLQTLLETLSLHRDSINRNAVLTADVVLAVPDTRTIRDTPSHQYPRKLLDRDFPEIYQAMLTGIDNDLFVPQLHGLEHLNGEAFAELCKSEDPRTEKALADENWWDWEALDSPLQGHYVDGSSLPTKPINPIKAQGIIETATNTFEKLFGQPSLTTVAPCYLWNDQIESMWSHHSIQAIQTAGYRCNGRAKDGGYIQDKLLIRTGEKSIYGQIYLVRNVMFEPVDGKNTPESAYQEALRAYRQALPITISTHRYNFTRTEAEFKLSLDGLSSLLNKLTLHIADTRFLSSAELAEALRSPDKPINNLFNNKKWPQLNSLQGKAKLSPFLYRLYYRHPKLALISNLSGLILPGWIISQILNQKKNIKQ